MGAEIQVFLSIVLGSSDESTSKDGGSDDFAAAIALSLADGSANTNANTNVNAGDANANQNVDANGGGVNSIVIDQPHVATSLDDQVLQKVLQESMGSHQQSEDALLTQALKNSEVVQSRIDLEDDDLQKAIAASKQVTSLKRPRADHNNSAVEILLSDSDEEVPQPPLQPPAPSTSQNVNQQTTKVASFIHQVI